MSDQAALWLAQAVCHPGRVDHELCSQMRCELPADDHPAVAIEDEREVDEAVPGAQVGDVGNPFLVRAGRSEVTLQQVTRLLERGLVRDRRTLLLAAADTFESLGPHQSSHPVAADLDPSPPGFLPDLAHPVHAPVALAGGADLRHQLPVLELTPGRLPGSARVVRAHPHADRTADRLDPEGLPSLLHIAGHRRRVGSSSCAK